MTAALDIQDAALVDLRFDKVIFLSNQGKRSKNIESCNSLRCPLDTDNLLSDFVPDICKQFIFLFLSPPYHILHRVKGNQFLREYRKSECSLQYC